MSPLHWRLLVDPPGSGAWNMAVDEALLKAHVPAPGPPTLRLYRWRPAALSLGANQPATRDPQFLRDEAIQLVRRPTGGLAVLHEQELTYSVSGGLRGPAFPGAVLDTYLRIAEALVGALELLGVSATISGPAERSSGAHGRPGSAACFGSTSAHEIRVADRKLIGSAQLRRRGAFLQHGSIPLVADPSRLARAIGGAVGEASIDLATALGRPADVGALTEAVIRSFSRRFEADLVAGPLTAAEREEATLLYSWKYLAGGWTLGGVNPRGSLPRGTGSEAG